MDEDAYKKHNKPETGANAGVYKHPDIPGEELIATSFVQADAFVRQGWVYDREYKKPVAQTAEEQAQDLIAGQKRAVAEENNEKKGK